MYTKTHSQRDQEKRLWLGLLVVLWRVQALWDGRTLTLLFEGGKNFPVQPFDYGTYFPTYPLANSEGVHT